MGGYGALLLAEKHPGLIGAAAAISPAVWTTYAQARSANAGAFASAEDFASDDVITHASALTGVPVRIASGTDDPFHPGVVALAKALPRSTIVDITQDVMTARSSLASSPHRLRSSPDISRPRS